MDRLIAKFCGLIEKVMSRAHMGSSLPGKLALKYNSNILKELSEQYKVILVTGTNGKTTTASIIAKIINDAGYAVIHNYTGANMLSGITTLFLKHQNDKVKEFAVVEIDEASVPLYTKLAKADFLVGTNIFIDQLDRYGEIYTTLNKLKTGIKDAQGIKLILNGDEPLFGNFNGHTVFFGFKNNIQDSQEIANVEGQFCVNCGIKYSYEFRTYNHLGDYHCKKCDSKRPHLKYSVKDITLKNENSMTFIINNTFVKTNIGGKYNIYNILSAFATAKEIGIEEKVITKSIESYKPHFGRSEEFEYNGKKIRLSLVKNPVSLNQSFTVSTGDCRKICGCFILNDFEADGIDISWIWDVDLEDNMHKFSHVMVGGTRKHDMALRIRIAGYPVKKLKLIDDMNSVIDYIKRQADCKNLYIFATYTAMFKLRKKLARHKLINHAW